jgi:hypothetical protein
MFNSLADVDEAIDRSFETYRPMIDPSQRETWHAGWKRAVAQVLAGAT